MIKHLGIVLVALNIGVAASTEDQTTSTEGQGEMAAGSDDDDVEAVFRMAYQLNNPARGTTFDLDPSTSPDAFEFGMYQLVYGGLARFTPDGEVVPDLAESVTLIDTETIEVVMREGAVFPDGAAIDAEAVKGALEARLATPDIPGYGADFYNLSSVDVVDDMILRLTIAGGTAAAWYDIALPGSGGIIVPPGTDFSQPSGAGPFRVLEHAPGERLILEKNPEYWDADSIQVDRIEIVNAVDAQSRMAALNSGQVDWTTIDHVQINAADTGLTVDIREDAANLVSLTMCKTEEPFTNPDVRRALSMAIDREAISDAIFGGRAVPASSLWPDDHDLYNPDVADLYPYDPDAAREMLAEAGYPDGFEFSIIPIPTAGMPEIAQVVQQEFAEIGVTMKIEQTSNFIEDVYVNPTVPMSVTSTTSGSGLRRLQQWSGPAIGNICDYADPALNAVVQELSTVQSGSPEAAELWQKAQEIVVGDALSIFVAFQPSVTAYNPERFDGEPVRAGAPGNATLGLPDLRSVVVRP